MTARIDLSGHRFGKWTVLSYAGNGRWECFCDCGARRTRDGASLRLGRSVSCKRCSLAAGHPRKTHGEARTRIHNIWLGMKRRCLNPKDGAYPRYGGRGITIAPAWEASFETFRDWALANGYRPDLTIDRKDNDGPYSPANCRWATYAQQNRNHSRNRHVDFRGQKVAVVDLAEAHGLKPHTLRQRLFKFGWDVEKAIATPGRVSETITVGGQALNFNDACKKAGLTRALVKKRLGRGWSVEEALTL